MHVSPNGNQVKKKKEKENSKHTEIFFFHSGMSFQFYCLLYIIIIENKLVSIKMKFFDLSRVVFPLALRRVSEIFFWIKMKLGLKMSGSAVSWKMQSQQPSFAVQVKCTVGLPQGSAPLLKHRREKMPPALHSQCKPDSSCFVVATRNMETSSWT